MINGTILNRNKTHVDEIFAFAIASDVINEEDNVPKSLEECRYKNDWPKWKAVVQAELSSLDKRQVFGLVV